MPSGGSTDFQVRIKAVMDVGDVVSNVGAIQKSFGKLKLPDKIGQSLNKNITEFYKEYEKYQKRVSTGIKTQGDYTAVEKSLTRMKTLYGDIAKELQKTTNIDIEDLINLDSGQFKKVIDQITAEIQKINNVKIDKNALADPIKQIESLTKSKTVTGDNGLLQQIMGHINTGEIDQAKKAFIELQKYAQKVAPQFDAQGNNLNVRGTMGVEKYEALKIAISSMASVFNKADAEAAPFRATLDSLEKELSELEGSAQKDILKGVGDFSKAQKDVEKVTDSLKRMHEEEFSFNRQAQDIDRQIQSYFGLSQMIRKVGEIARDAFQTVKELDAAMVETAVVTNFDVGDMWDMLPTYTANANQLGATIKDVYEAATLYFQQGLNLSQSMGLANETLKMARIGGLQAAEATNMMTAALRGFNMEINQLSAKRINDVYSELAAITAADTKEIGSAMERTASIANSANMEFETTSAFLAQMIETTREAPENLGTAMKTIIARFQEMKQDPTKLVDSEGVALDANKIDTALKTIGVDLKNQKGEFRDLDDVFLDISEKWDSLTQGQQRYIATIAAGSRQQSRFIAMMQNYERVKELVDAANNSAGAGQKQFEKTLEGLSAKLNKFKNAWDQFTMGLMNSQLIKAGVDALTGFFTIVNKLFGLINKIPDPFGGIVKSIVTLVSTLSMLQLGKKGARGLVMGGVGWWSGEGFTKNFKAGFGVKEASVGGKESGKAWTKSFVSAVGQNSNIKNAIKNATTAAKTEGVKNTTFNKAYGALTGNQAFQIINSKTMGPQFESAIREALVQACRSVQSESFGEQEADEFIDGFINKIRQGKIEGTLKQELQHAGNEGKLSSADIGDIPIENTSEQFDQFYNKVTKAGDGLMSFGMILQQTPLAPFGTALTMAGSVLMSFGSSLTLVKEAYIENIAIAKADAIAKAGDAAATEVLGDVQLGTAAKAKALGAALWTSLGPLALIAAAIAAVVVAYKALDAAIVTDKEALETTTDAAAAASEAFDLAKQETSELNDAISRIQENDSAFDNLVAGTAEFNEQMVTANQQITDLLQKYPMLNDYVSTDKNGLMHISNEGLKAVKEYQKQIQARASAINIIQAADLAALENQQKADKLRSNWGKDVDQQKKDQENANLLEQQADAEKQAAQLNAIRTSLASQEISNIEAISAAYANLYDEKRKAAEADVASMSKNDIRQAYADYHGYTYNKSTKKIKDAEGNEVDYDDAVIKDEVIEQTVMLDFEANAGTLDTVLSDLDDKFSNVLSNSFDGADHIISDILSGNIETNTDVLEKILSENSTDLQDLVNSLSENEIGAILGISADQVQNTDFDKVTDLLTEKAEALAEAQFESYSNLASMMAQASGMGLAAVNTNTIQNSIRKEIDALSTQQAATLSTIGQTLNQNVGPEAMKSFINTASDIYLSQDQELIDEFDELIGEINWESAASRLEGYNKAIDSSNETIQAWGESMRNSADELNIVGEAFDEFVGGDWEKLSENADEFKNAMGEIDAAGIMEAAEQSKSLKSLLDSGEVSAFGVANALQGIEEGKYSVGGVNTVVLQLLSSLHKLEETAVEAHKIIEDFDPGIDFGEGEDFMKENAEKVKEYMGNQEWGNQQLQNYIKLAAGNDLWNETLRKNDGNLKETTQDLSKYVTAFSNGTVDVWDKLTKGKGLNGKTVADNIKNADIEKPLKEKFDKIQAYWDKNGDLQFKGLENLTTDEFETYLKEALGLSEEYAKLMAANLMNYSETEAATLQANDLAKTIRTAEFQNAIARDKKGRGILTDTSWNILKDTLNSADLESLAKSLGYVATESQTAADSLEGNLFQTLKNGKEITDGLDLARNYAQRYHTDETGGRASARSLAKVKDFQDASGRLDISKLQTGLGEVYSPAQVSKAIWETYRKVNAQGQTMSFNGQELKKDIASEAEFQLEIDKATESSQWITVGETIAQGMVNYINGTSNPFTDDSGQTPGSTGQYQRTDTLNKAEFKELQSAAKEAEKSINKVDQSTDKGIQKANKLKDAFVQANLEGLARMNPSQFNKINDKLQFTKDELQAIQDKRTEINIDADTSDVDADTQRVISTWGEFTQNVDSNPVEFKADGSKAEKEVAGVASSWGDLVQQGKTNPLQIKTKTDKPKNKNDDKSTTQATKEISVTYTGTIANAAELQQSLQKQLKTIFDAVAKQSQKLNINATTTTTSKSSKGSDKGSKGKTKATAGSQVMKVTADVSAAQKRIDSLISKLKKTQTLKYKASGPKSIKVPIRADFKGSWEKKVKINKAEKGLNNYIAHQQLPALGSLARGSRYGRLGPRGKGGLTLTGEKGYEIAWIPSESRSMILGSKGPQMVNLPKDAVVYTHEQSEDILRKRQTIDAGSHSGIHKSTSTGVKINKGRSGSGKSGSSGSGGKKKKETINNWSIEEAVRFNIDLELITITDEIEKQTKELEDILTKIGTTYGDIVDLTKDQVEALKGVKEYNQEIVDSYQRQLDDYYEQQAIVSWTNNQGKSKDRKINIKDYIDENGTINQEALEKIESRAEREAVFKEVSSVKNLIDGIKSANKAIKDADNQIADLNKKIFDAFYGWDNELTEVYDLTQRINDETSLTNRFTSQVELELAKLNAGFGETAQAISNTRKVLTRNNDVIQKQIQNQQQMIAARQRELEAALSTEDELQKLNRFRELADLDDESLKKVQNQYTGAELGRKYVTNLFKDLDGHIEYDIDWERFNADNEVNPYTKDTYDAIKAYLDNLNDKATEFNDSIKNQTDFIKETYEALREYQENIANMEDTLIKGVEEEIDKETDNAKKISDSITNALKDLLDEVKRKLDERRKQEDNAKTERDIAQKQQRLAALRADTAGGHQVEIAQLEKEIADAQSSYGRTLEDQLLDRLQQQADDAAKQRERLIELQETSNEISRENNKEIVNLWLRDPEQYKAEIRAAWLEAQGYEDKGRAGQYILEQEFEKVFTELVTAVEQSGFNSAEGIFTATADNTETLVNLLTQLTNNENFGRDDELAHAINSLTDATHRNTETLLQEVVNSQTAASARERGVDVGTLKAIGFSAQDLVGEDANNPIYSVPELRSVGFSAGELKGAGVSAAQMKAGGYTAKELKDEFDLSTLKDIGFTAKELKAVGFDASQLKAVNYTLKNLKSAGFNTPELKDSGYTLQELKNVGFSIGALSKAFSKEEFGSNGVSYEEAKGVYSAEQLKDVAEYEAEAQKEISLPLYEQFLIDRGTSKKNKKLTSNNGATLGEIDAAALKEQIERAKWLGKTPFDVWTDLTATPLFTGGGDKAIGRRKKLMLAFRELGYTESEIKSWNPNATAKSVFYNDFYRAFRKKNKKNKWEDKKTTWNRYYKGGLANFTGPAWLDGTPSKPELVLNSADTKNFLALRDVLGKAMSSSNSINNSYGNSMYEININVDHINNDYDVDRIADRVKKNIIRDANYRNVTQVRNFR